MHGITFTSVRRAPRVSEDPTDNPPSAMKSLMKISTESLANCASRVGVVLVRRFLKNAPLNGTGLASRRCGGINADTAIRKHVRFTRADGLNYLAVWRRNNYRRDYARGSQLPYQWPGDVVRCRNLAKYSGVFQYSGARQFAISKTIVPAIEWTLPITADSLIKSTIFREEFSSEFTARGNPICTILN